MRNLDSLKPLTRKRFADAGPCAVAVVLASGLVALMRTAFTLFALLRTAFTLLRTAFTLFVPASFDRA